VIVRSTPVLLALVAPLCLVACGGEDVPVRDGEEIERAVNDAQRLVDDTSSDTDNGSMEVWEPTLTPVVGNSLLPSSRPDST
jgi:hypothetical protein